MSHPLYALLIGILLFSCGSDNEPDTPPINDNKPAPVLQKSLGGTNVDQSPIIRGTPDGGFIIAAQTFSNDVDISFNHSNDADIWLAKLSSSLDITWEKSLGGSVAEGIHDVLVLEDGGYLLGGTSNSLDGDLSWNNGSIDWWLVRLDATGTIQWETNLGGTRHEVPGAMVQVGNEFMIAGSTASTDGDVGHKLDDGDRDLWMVRVNDNGQLLWEHTYGVSNRDEGGIALFHTDDDGFLVAAEASGDIWMVQFDHDLNINWEKFLGGTAEDELITVQTTPEGGYIVLATSSSNDGDVSGNYGGSDLWVARLNDQADIVWERNLGGSDTDLAGDIQIVADGSYWVSGSTSSSDHDIPGNHGELDYWVANLDSNGALVWSQNYGGSQFDRVTSLAKYGNTGVILAGSTRSSDGDVLESIGTLDIWLLALE